jgi:hypothetical protein
MSQVIPARDDTRLAPIIDQGCANGLAGAANSNTADAPMLDRICSATLAIFGYGRNLPNRSYPIMRLKPIQN